MKKSERSSQIKELPCNLHKSLRISPSFCLYFPHFSLFFEDSNRFMEIRGDYRGLPKLIYKIIWLTRLVYSELKQHLYANIYEDYGIFPGNLFNTGRYVLDNSLKIKILDVGSVDFIISLYATLSFELTFLFFKKKRVKDVKICSKIEIWHRLTQSAFPAATGSKNLFKLKHNISSFRS